jgi:hypothetical protein
MDFLSPILVYCNVHLAVRTNVNEVGCNVDCFWQQVHRNVTFKNKTSNPYHDSSMFLLNYTILMRKIN